MLQVFHRGNREGGRRREEKFYLGNEKLRQISRPQGFSEASVLTLNGNSP